jgi:predicted N-acetyltransferase YhbS
MLPTIEPIAAGHDFTGFNCGRPSLNEWLSARALANHQAGYTHVRVALESGRIIGYYGIASASVVSAGVPRKLRGSQPPNPLPAILIGRFAVDLSAQSRGIGKALFRDALLRSLAVAELIAARVVVIHALDPHAAAFYARYGFIATEGDPLTLYQAVERIAAAL